MAALITFLIKHLLENGLASLFLDLDLNTSLKILALPPTTKQTSDQAELNIFLYHISTPHGYNLTNPIKADAKSRGTQIDSWSFYYHISVRSKNEFESEFILDNAIKIITSKQSYLKIDLDTIINQNKPINESKYIDSLLSQSSFKANDLEIQFHPQILDADQTSKLWSALQLPLRPSVIFKITAKSISKS